MSCSKPLPELTNFDLQTWKNDPNACLNKRAAFQQSIETQKEKLLGLKETQITKVLGKPDRNELYKRNQKFFYYYILPASTCDNPATESLRLTIRFNAMGLAKEIFFE